MSRNRGVKSTDSQGSQLPEVVTVSNSKHNSGQVNRRGDRRAKQIPAPGKNKNGKATNSSSVRYDGQTPLNASLTTIDDNFGSLQEGLSAQATVGNSAKYAIPIYQQQVAKMMT